MFGKGDKERRVYFDAKAKLHLQDYLRSRTDANPALFVTLDTPFDRLKISGVEIRMRELGREPLNLDKIHPPLIPPHYGNPCHRQGNAH